jgi:uncharacterized SAM-binding protein YcdF (DUF218 family)
MLFMDFFVIKKIISALIMPLSLVLLLLIIGLITHHKRPKFSVKCLAASTLVLFLSCFAPLADLLMKPLEHSYPAFTESKQKIDYIVMLGCYQVTDDSLPATSQLGACSLQRLVEGLRIYQQHPEAMLLMSGAAFSNSRSNAQTMKLAAISLGVAEHKILTEDFPKDTEQEAQLIAARIAGSHSVLITNADHMLRAMKYFQQYGAQPVAAPVYTWVKDNNLAKPWQYFVPTARKLEQTTTAWYEGLGLVVQWLKKITS